jgi:hypothetical protein
MEIGARIYKEIITGKCVHLVEHAKYEICVNKEPMSIW